MLPVPLAERMLLHVVGCVRGVMNFVLRVDEALYDMEEYYDGNDDDDEDLLLLLLLDDCSIRS